MRLFPIRFALVLGELRVIEATLFERDAEEEAEIVNNDTLFGFQVASDEAVDEVELNLATEEARYATS